MSFFIFYASSGGDTTTLNILASEVTFVVCTVNSSLTLISSSCVTLPASGDADCGVGEDGSRSTPQKASNDSISPQTPRWLLVMASNEQSCSHRIRFLLRGAKWGHSDVFVDIPKLIGIAINGIHFALPLQTLHWVVWTACQPKSVVHNVGQDNPYFHLPLGWWIVIFGWDLLWPSLFKDYKCCMKVCPIKMKC